jgi:tRNA pseudouridine38-40 synthase
VIVTPASEPVLYAAQVAYDGSAYNGFQRQAGSTPTIQGELERVLEALTNESITVSGAGRTDSGVHALGQVIAFRMGWRHGRDALQNAMNANLPADIAILQLTTAEEGFHPRYKARQRVYRYQIWNNLVRRPSYLRSHWHVKQPLDLQKMNQAAALLVGEHDFATFGQPPQGNNTVRVVETAVWQQSGRCLTFHIAANAFLYRMVRSIVGSLRKVGDGSWHVDQFAEALQAADRASSAPTAPAQGLFLENVLYEPEIFPSPQ